MRQEEKASGIDVPDQTQLDDLLGEILEREKIAKGKSDSPKPMQRRRKLRRKNLKPKR